MHFRATSILLLAALLFGWFGAAQAEDPYDPIFADTVKFDCPVDVGWPPPDSIGLPIYIWADDSLGSFTLGFVSNSPYLTWGSFSPEGSVFPEIWTWPTPYIVPEEGKMLIGGYDATGIMPAIYPQGLLGTIYVYVNPAIPHSSVCDIDSAKVGLAGDFVLTVIHQGPPAWAVGIIPEFVQCGTGEIIFGTPVCGDANSDGPVNVADAAFLVSYVLGGGPAPDPLEAGDADCDGLANVTDAVYLIAYVFDDGPAPCESCP